MQIPHALFRNILVPMFMLIYLVDTYTDLDFDQFFKWSGFAVLTSIPVYAVLALYGYNLIDVVVSQSWTSWLSPVQYLVFVFFVNRRVHDVTCDSSYSFCLSMVAAAVSGYLYEVPRWIMRDGLFGVFRTAKMSFIVLDFGMLAVPFLFFMLRGREVKVNLLLVLSGLVYMVYVVFYAQFIGFYIHSVYPLVGLSTTVLCRVPAMWFVYQLVTTKSSNNDLK